MTREHGEFTIYERPEQGDPDVAFRRNLPRDTLLNSHVTDAERAALLALEIGLSPPVGIPWEPIATAPPDNTVVLLWSQGDAVQGSRLSPEFATATHWAPLNAPVTAP